MPNAIFTLGASAWADNFNLVSAINSILQALAGELHSLYRMRTDVISEWNGYGRSKSGVLRHTRSYAGKVAIN